ncbi:MAG: phosphoribosyltransferase family protein [Phycisphaerales bacterium]|jgi:hypoxanthine phosphoribosyltransferase|nr:phosphoribosyltransferase family protein [Phycisphaerales bacterium]
MYSRIDRILIDRDSIADRVEQLGSHLVADLGSVADQSRLMVVPVMTGSLFFTADLMRHLPLAFRIQPVTVSSYPGASTTSQGIKETSRMPEGIEGMTVLVVDDILDSGRTLEHLRVSMLNAGAADVRFCVLLRKDVPRVVEVECHYVGFDIPDSFVVGYGLDYDGLYRNVPDIAVMKGGPRPEAADGVSGAGGQ